MSTIQFIPTFLKIWFFASALIVFFDASFVLLRPQSLKGGNLYQYFFLYDNYTLYDTLYANLTDSFVVIQSWLNIVQGVFLLAAVLLSLSTSLSSQFWGSIIGVLTSTCVFWKTVIFVWYDDAFITQSARNFTSGSIFCYWLPSSLWLIFPLLSMILIPKRIMNYIQSQITPKSKQQ